MKKIFTIDLDGTLLTKKKKITKKSIISLKKYILAGGEPVIITGKSRESSMKYINILNAKLNYRIKYIGTSNGSVLIDLIKDKIIYQDYISGTESKKVFDFIKANNSVFFAYAGSDDMIENLYFFNWSIPKFLIRKSFSKNANFTFMSEYLNVNYQKIGIFPKLFKKNRMNEIFNDVSSLKSLNIYKTHKLFYEISPLTSNKGKCLKTIAKFLEVDIENTAAIGDSYNDIPVFKVAGISFGIDNKQQNFRESCSILIKRSNKEPVSFAIENYLLK